MYTPDHFRCLHPVHPEVHGKPWPLFPGMWVQGLSPPWGPPALLHPAPWSGRGLYLLPRAPAGRGGGGGLQIVGLLSEVSFTFCYWFSGFS